MYVFFTDINFDYVSPPLEDINSMSITLRYYDFDEFQLVMPDKYYQYIKNAKYIYNADLKQYMVIVSYSVNENQLTIKGKSLNYILNTRILTSDISEIKNKNVEDFCRLMVDANAITDRPITNLILGDSSNISYTDTCQASKGNKLGDKVFELCKLGEMSYKIEYDEDTKKLIFSVFQGIDRTTNQSENTFAIFSSSYENLKNNTYENSVFTYSNVGYYQNSSGIITNIDLRSDTNEERREIWLSSKNESEAKQEMQNNNKTENITGEVLDTDTLQYGTNYNIGDLIDVVDISHNIQMETRIEAIEIVYEKGIRKIIPSFGSNGNISTVKLIKSIVKE